MTDERRAYSWVRRAVMITVGLVVIGSVVALSRYWIGPAPAQPIPFSHRIHVQTKAISCFFCHPSAGRSSNAGLPSVQKCLLCHAVIASRFPPIAKITRYYDRGQGTPWVRVNKLPEHVHFSHRAHIARRFDCSECHGNVRAMDRVGVAHRLDMNFCVTCHWRNKGPDSCVACHY